MECGEDRWRWQVFSWPSVKAEDVAGLSSAELEMLVSAQKEHNQAIGCAEDLHESISCLSERDLHTLATRLHECIVAETDLLERFIRLGLDPFTPDLLELPLPYPVVVMPEASACALSGARACYRQGIIHLAGEPPSLAERIALLATRGIIANDLFHEVFHGLQDDGQDFHSLEEVLDAVAASEVGVPDHKVAVAEAHAWLCCLPGFRHDLIAEVIGGCYRIEGRGLRAAIDLVYGLAVLGLDDEQIGKLVAQATWCPERGIYVELERERERLLALAGWTLGDLADAIARQHLLDRLQVMRAVGIARELAREMMDRCRVANDLAGVAV